MKNCALIINSLSGNSLRVDEACLTEVFGADHSTVTIHIFEDTILKDLSSFDRIVVCGGDGTLNNVVNCTLSPNVQLFYLPYGTLNEIQHNSTSPLPQFSDLGKAGDRYFTYVCAAGIFTPLGYVVSPKRKKRWKKLAYFSKILREYKVHRIKAQFELNGQQHVGEYSLLMAIDSPQCFGCKFNKMYRQDDGLLHFLAIKAPKHNGLLGKIALFFPLFRTFFVGYRRPRHTKNVLFEPCTKVNVSLQDIVPFDMDGEKINMRDSFEIGIEKQKYKIRIVSRVMLLQMRQQAARQKKKSKKTEK